MTLFENDLLLIVRLAFPSAKTVFVLDPGKTVIRNYDSGFTFLYTRDQVITAANEKRTLILLNISGASSFSYPFNFSNVDGIISFNISYDTSIDYFHFELYYVVDQKDKIRWIISEKHKNTAFLQDYHQYQFVTDVGNFFSGFSSLSNYLNVKFGKLGKVTDGNFQVLKKDKNFFDGIENDKYESFIIQLDNPLIPDYLRIKLYDHQKCCALINHAILPAGIKSIENEKMVISEISGSEFKNFAIPDFKSSDYSVCYFLPPESKPTHHKQTRLLINNNLIKVINEFQKPFCREIPLKEFWNGNDVVKNLNYIKSRIAQNLIPRGLSAANLARLYAGIIKIFNKLDLNEPVYVSLNNYSFNSENIYSAEQKLYFTSWVNANFDLPLFSDLFFREKNYADEPGKLDADNLVKNIEILMNNPELLEVAADYKIQVSYYLKLFIVISCCKEIQQIISKKIVLPEVNIVVFNWLSLVEFIDPNPD